MFLDVWQSCIWVHGFFLEVSIINTLSIFGRVERLSGIILTGLLVQIFFSPSNLIWLFELILNRVVLESHV